MVILHTTLIKLLIKNQFTDKTGLSINGKSRLSINGSATDKSGF